jgi:predicted PurR-regulated permease PerM
MNTPPPLPTTPTSDKGWQARWFHVAMWAGIIALAIFFLRAVEPILLPFVLGMLVAYVMDPLATCLERRGMGRSLATAIITLSLFTILTSLVIWLVPILYTQFITLLSRAPALMHAIEGNLHSQATPLLKNLNRLTGGESPDAIPADPSELIQRGFVAVSGFANRILESGAALINVLALLLITPIVCFYLIRDWPKMVRSTDRLLPLAYAPTIRTQIFLINRTLSAYLRGQITVMLIMSVFYIIGLTVFGLNFSLVLGLLAGCIVIVPYIGSIISISLGLLVAHGQYDTGTGFWLIVGVYATGQILESQILTPKIIGDRVGLHPLWMLFGMLAGAVLLGFAGVLLAVPLTAVIGVLVKFTIRRYLESGLYLEQ